jgi:hypothetical protein
MDAIKSLANRIRGWLPKEPYLAKSKESGNGKSGTAAYIVGYGVGIGACESFLLLSYALGWGTIESSLSADWGVLSGILVVLPGTLLGLAVGAKLSKKLKERWAS